MYSIFVRRGFPQHLIMIYAICMLNILYVCITVPQYAVYRMALRDFSVRDKLLCPIIMNIMTWNL